MSKLDALLERMAALVGISPSYTDAFGQSVETRPETQRALLAGLGLGIETLGEAQESLAWLERLKAGAIPAIIPVEASRSARVRLRASLGAATWSLTEENGAGHEGRLAKGDTALEIPALP